MRIELPLPKIHRSIYRDNHRFQVLNAGRRFGKSLLLGAKIIKNWMRTYRQGNRVLPAKIWYIAPTYTQGKQIFWGRAKELLRDITEGKPNESELKINLKQGGEFCIKGSDNPSSLRGSYLTCALLDEAAFHKPGVWQTVIRPMLADVRGEAAFYSTPDGFNEFYELFKKGQGDDPDWISWQFPSTSGGFISAEEVEAAKVDMDLETWRQEFHAEFIGRSGRVYYNFDRSRHVKPVQYVAGLDIHWAWDFNVNPCVHSALSHDYKNKIYTYDEICQGETPDVVEEFISRYPVEVLKDRNTGKSGNIYIYGDFTGSISTTGVTDYQIIEHMLVRKGYPKPEIRVYGGNPIERDRTNVVNGVLVNADNQVGIYIHPRCNVTIRDFEQVMRNDTNGKIDKIKDRRLTHVSDAIGYMLYVLRPPKWGKFRQSTEIREKESLTGWWV